MLVARINYDQDRVLEIMEDKEKTDQYVTSLIPIQLQGNINLLNNTIVWILNEMLEDIKFDTETRIKLILCLSRPVNGYLDSFSFIQDI